MIDLHQDQPDYSETENDLVLPYSFEAVNAFGPAEIARAYGRGGVIESDERVDYYRDDDGNLQSKPRFLSIRYVIDKMQERDRAKLEREQWTMFKFD